MTSNVGVVGRAICAGCARPQVVCLCRHLVRVAPRTRVVVLQHPGEADNPIGTAWMVERCLSATRIVGIELEGHPDLDAALGDPDAPPILLAPGPDAIDLGAHPPHGPVTLVVLDGTWPQAKKLLRVNPRLARLPRYAFQPAQPSQYRIRREPAAHCVSTIEATVAALAHLEPIDCERVLAPFHAMVEQQLRIADEKRHSRHLLSAIARHARRPEKTRRAPLDERNLVVAYGEANAWPRGTEHGPHPELVHVVAERLSTGERFEAYVAPERPLSPSLTKHTGIPAERVLAGEPRDRFAARFAEFLREGDRLAVWGFFTLELLRKVHAPLPDVVDLRTTAVRHLGRRGGDAIEMARALACPIDAPWAMYRTGLRHAAAKSVARALARVPG